MSQYLTQDQKVNQHLIALRTNRCKVHYLKLAYFLISKEQT